VLQRPASRFILYLREARREDPHSAATDMQPQRDYADQARCAIAAPTATAQPHTRSVCQAKVHDQMCASRRAAIRGEGTRVRPTMFSP